VNVKFATKDDIVRVISEARSTVLGPPKSASKKLPKPTDSQMLFKLIAEGGRVKMEPLIDASLPKTTVEGEISTENGFSIKLFLDKFFVGYGQPSMVRALDRGLSPQQLGQLPDNVRLRVLLFLKDLRPLEAALGLPESTNTFLRCRAVNKGLVKLSEKLEMQALTDQAGGPPARRRELMHRISMLDDDTIEAMLIAHERRCRMTKSSRR
jgi:hypothetical protein